MKKLKGNKRKKQIAADLCNTAPQAAAAAAAAVAAHNRTTQSIVRLMASGSFSEVVAMKNDVLEAIKTLELMGITQICIDFGAHGYRLGSLYSLHVTVYILYMSQRDFTFILSISRS